MIDLSIENRIIILSVHTNKFNLAEKIDRITILMHQIADMKCFFSVVLFY